MDPARIADYRCPETGSSLRLEGGALVSVTGRRFPIENDVPNLLWPAELSAGEERTKQTYDRIAEEIYDNALQWQFAVIYEDEDRVRESMLDLLDLEPGHRVLEVGCGTGRDSHRIARRLDVAGALFMQDLSPGMVHSCVRRMVAHGKSYGFRCRLDYTISNATHLPYADGFFDRVFHFGGFNEFGDLKRGAAEFARVVKQGGKVVFGDEGVAPWLRDTEFGGIVITNNRLFANPLPLDALPECARDVSVRWIMANCFWLVSFTKGDGSPPLDLDLPHKGSRGGTLRTRYYGVIEEGVDPKTKELVRKAAAKEGLSIHEWLERTVRERALAGLGPGTAGS
jgi:ubiquinone/menaquinone biosynthesis C-methylase UbiE